MKVRWYTRQFLWILCRLLPETQLTNFSMARIHSFIHSFIHSSVYWMTHPIKSSFLELENKHNGAGRHLFPASVVYRVINKGRPLPVQWKNYTSGLNVLSRAVSTQLSWFTCISVKTILRMWPHVNNTVRRSLQTLDFINGSSIVITANHWRAALHSWHANDWHWHIDIMKFAIIFIWRHSLPSPSRSISVALTK